MTTSAAAWLPFLASPAAPKNAPSPLVLEGYLTGIVVAPEMIRPSRWVAGLWGGEEPVFDDDGDIQTVFGAVMMRHNTLLAEIDEGLKRLEDKNICDYRPAFLTASKPPREAVRDWVVGFWKAMALAPEGWTALVQDERLQVILTPFVGFLDLGSDEPFEPADDIDERLDESVEQIPRAILILHKLAKLRAARGPTEFTQSRRTKVGRNDPCPCGSGTKYKRCCAQS